MKFTLSSLIPYLIYSFKSEDELVKAIEEVSLKFTTNRDNIADYLNNPRLVAAYTCFYLLTNIPKLSEVMKWMPQDWVDSLKNCDLIDLGAGPGTFSLAWKEYGGKGQYYQIEQSSLMRDQARKIWDGLYKDSLHQSPRWQNQSGKEKFLLFGHSANEMSLTDAINYIESISPDHILFIEPGTKDFFSKMLEIRKYLLSKNFNILYPCPGSGDCPMSGTKDWCHQFIQIKHHDEIERISQMAKKDRKLLPLTVQAFSTSFKYQNPRERIVRVLPETKFGHEWMVCHDNQIDHYQIMKRDLSKEETKMLSAKLSGAAITTEIVKVVDKIKRVKFIK